MSYSNLYRIIIYFAVCNFQGTMLADLIKSIRTCQDCKVEIKGFEPLTPCLQGRCSPNWAIPPEVWHPLMFPRRYQRSIFSRSGLNHRVRDGNGCYPWPHRHHTMELSGLEPPTSRLSGVRSNQLSYSSIFYIGFLFLEPLLLVIVEPEARR